jgi:hypothetical protein
MTAKMKKKAKESREAFLGELVNFDLMLTCVPC